MASTNKKTSSSTTQKNTSAKATPKATSKATSKATASKTSTKAKATVSPVVSPEVEMARSVVFTEDPLDQEILEAIDLELKEAVFGSFDELCKEALCHFLWEDPDAPQPESSSPDSMETRLMAQIEGLQQQLTSVIQLVSALMPAELIVTTPEPIAEPTIQPIVEPIVEPITEPIVKSVRVEENDPFLDRLSALLEDF
jgi:hypothetical protein